MKSTGLATPEIDGDLEPPKRRFVENPFLFLHGVIFAILIFAGAVWLCALLGSLYCDEDGACLFWCPSERRLFCIAVLAATLGGLIHAATSFASFAGNRELVRSWMPWLYLRAPIGGLVGVVVYLGYRSYFFETNGTLAQCHLVYRYAFASAMAGLFSKQVVDLLGAVLGHLFRVRAAEDRKDKMGEEAPPAGSKPEPEWKKGPSPGADVVRAVQRRLIDGGFLPQRTSSGKDSVDGVLDDRTRTGIQVFFDQQRIVGELRAATIGDEGQADYWPNLPDLLEQAADVAGRTEEPRLSKRMIPLQARYFKRLNTYLIERLPNFAQAPTGSADKKVWDTFVHFAHDDQATARAAVSDERPNGDTPPWFFVERLGERDGIFDRRRPTTVSLGKRLVEDFEWRGSGQPEDELEATIFHELVHWAWRNHEEEEEMGHAFEAAAYGGRPVPARREPPRPSSTDPARRLGALSRGWESLGNPAIVAHDTNGGWSYGLYQLSSRQGTLGEFLRFLAGVPRYRVFAEDLKAAGGDVAARRGSDVFQRAWTKVALDDDFGDAQHEFIKATHYEPLVKALVKEGIDANARPKLREVVWSVGVQHGERQGTLIFTRAAASLPVDQRSNDDALIHAVYDERSKVEIYFPSSTSAEQAAVRGRFEAERRQALA